MNFDEGFENGDYADIIWSLLRAKHIDLESEHYATVEDHEAAFSFLFSSLGFKLIRDQHGFYYLQKNDKMSSEERATANKYCALFFITVQMLQDKSGQSSVVGLEFLLDRKGFHLASLLSHGTLPDHLCRILNSVGLDTDEKIQTALNGMERSNFISGLHEEGHWRFRRPIARLERVARQFLYEEEEE